MQARRDRCAPRYGRRTVLGLALSPLLVGIARAEDETSKVDSGRLPPQPGDHFVFLTGPDKGQVVRPDNLAIGGPQVQAYPVSPDGTVRNETPQHIRLGRPPDAYLAAARQLTAIPRRASLPASPGAADDAT